MSVVIVGGNERMAAQYEGICKEHGCKAKVFTKENGSLKRKLGSRCFAHAGRTDEAQNGRL